MNHHQKSKFVVGCDAEYDYYIPGHYTPFLNIQFNFSLNCFISEPSISTIFRPQHLIFSSCFTESSAILNHVFKNIMRNHILQTKLGYSLTEQRMRCCCSCKPGLGSALIYEFNHIGNGVIIHGY